MHKGALLAILLGVGLLFIPAHSAIQFAEAQNPISDLAAKGAAAIGGGGIGIINTLFEAIATSGGLLGTILSVGLSFLNSLITFIFNSIISVIAFIINIFNSLFISILSSAGITLIPKIVAVAVMVFGFIEPIFKYVQSVAGGAILGYLAGYKDLIYYGFVRPILMEIISAGFLLLCAAAALVGIIPIVSIPMAFIYGFLVLMVIFPLTVSGQAYFPMDENINPIAQGLCITKMGFWGFVMGLAELIVFILLIFVIAAMIVPVTNIAMAIILVICATLGAIVVIILGIISALTNLIFILPTVLNYTPFIHLIGKGIKGLVVVIENLIFKGIDDLGAWIA